MYVAVDGFATPMAPRDARVCVQDGYIWPLLRHQMTTAEAIRMRMREDLTGFPGEKNHETSGVWLLMAGWDCSQIDAFNGPEVWS